MKKSVTKTGFIVVGILALAGYWLLAHWSPVIPSTSNPVSSAEQPSLSTAEAAAYDWHGKPDEPKKIIIDKIHVEAFVQQVGVDAKQRVAAPNNIHLAGWFKDSATPGKPGLSIIDGHVTWHKNDAVFKNLQQLVIGDEFTVELGSGTRLRFKVFNIQQLKEADSTASLFSQNRGIKSQLNLITCGGAYDGQTFQYLDRIIVSARPI